MHETLAVFVARNKREIWEKLNLGQPPHIGEFNLDVYTAIKSRPGVQIGTVTFSPSSITLEFLFPDPTSISAILPVILSVSERIVFMPVPTWVVESIWQGDIDGSYHFESDANALLAKYQEELTVSGNEKWFQKQLAKRRE